MAKTQDTLAQNKRVAAVEELQNQIYADDELAEELQAEQQSLIRYPEITNQQQADQYAQDLGLSDLRDIMDKREKALHLFGFYDFMEQQKQAEDYLENFIKIFQLTIFYDDNYVYRYFLAQHYFKLGNRASATTHIKDAVTKIKSKNTSLYASLARSINLQFIKNEINELLINLALPTLDEASSL